jgi:hypothetical protein
MRSAKLRMVVKHTVPVGDVLVGNAGGHIEHDDAALAVDVVSVSQAAELLLSSRVPDIEGDGAEVLSVSAMQAAAECGDKR